MGEVNRTFGRHDLRADTPEAAEIREKLAKHIEELAHHMRSARVRAFSLDWRNEPIEGPPMGMMKTFEASPFSDVSLHMEVELP